jgi:hypothetical protein
MPACYLTGADFNSAEAIRRSVCSRRFFLGKAFRHQSYYFRRAYVFRESDGGGS